MPFDEFLRTWKFCHRSSNCLEFIIFCKKNTEQNNYLEQDVFRGQWRVEVWWCQGRLLDWMAPYQILVLSSGVYWSFLLDIRSLWRHKTTSYSRLQTNIFAKFVDTTCILFCTHFLTRCFSMCHCHENKLLSALHVSRPEQNTALNQSRGHGGLC